MKEKEEYFRGKGDQQKSEQGAIMEGRMWIKYNGSQSWKCHYFASLIKNKIMMELGKKSERFWASLTKIITTLDLPIAKSKWVNLMNPRYMFVLIIYFQK